MNPTDFKQGFENALRDVSLYGATRAQERSGMFRQRLAEGGKDSYQLGYVAGVASQSQSKHK